MITSCPNCDALVPLNVESALQIHQGHFLCPSCEKPFKPFAAASEEAELKIEELKDELVIQKSLQNINRWNEDC